ncbi:molybdenum cofactor biosynthesis protein MoaE [Novipirellula sp. SH528]|uniref:molybdenum cofactor biosynthesis protein MoaE n=1 Tax=Novipirellula sp. SH528 TaxID=3454466 RepID=UPI003F9EC98D
MPDSYVFLTEDPIDYGPLLSKIADPDVGAHAWFYGVTRRITGDRITSLLSYEAHQPMALAELNRLAGEAIEQFGLSKIVIVHRLGEVPVGEASVVLGCSSAHRKQSFAALPWLMDQIKTDVPIWKRETYTDGTTQWVHPTDPATDSGTQEIEARDDK